MEKLNMGYDTIMGLWMYDFQNILERYTKMIEERNEAEKKQNEEAEKKYNLSPDKYMRQANQASNVKVPNFSNVHL